MKKFILLILIIVIAGFILISRNQEKGVSENGIQEDAKTETDTEITSRGFGGIKIVVSPSEGKTVKGVVTIDLTKVPDTTGIAAFGIYEQGNEDMSVGPNLGMDTDGSDGWGYILDTTNYDNGVYSVMSVVGESFEEGKEPTGGATVQVVIEN